MHTLSLAPDGCLRLGLPHGHHLDFRPIPEALALIQRILLASETPASPFEERYPTQHIIDRWIKNLSITHPEPPAPRHLPKPSNKRAQAAAKATFGLPQIDILI